MESSRSETMAIYTQPAMNPGMSKGRVTVRKVLAQVAPLKADASSSSEWIWIMLALVVLIP